MRSTSAKLGGSIHETGPDTRFHLPALALPRPALSSSPPLSFPHFNTMRQVKNIIKKSPIQRVSFNKTIACRVNMSSSNFGLLPAIPLLSARLVEAALLSPKCPLHLGNSSKHRCFQAAALPAGTAALRLPDLQRKTPPQNL